LNSLFFFGKLFRLDNGIIYQGKYEKDFLDICVKNNIKLERGLTIKYKLNNDDLIYFSDFFIKDLNLIIEVKSSWIWNKHIDKNLMKIESCLEQGFNYILIMDKKYEDFIKYLSDIPNYFQSVGRTGEM